jgi:hypothetical protein
VLPEGLDDRYRELRRRFEFLDGGDLTFYGDADDVRAGRWEKLLMEPQSS